MDYTNVDAKKYSNTLKIVLLVLTFTILLVALLIAIGGGVSLYILAIGGIIVGFVAVTVRFTSRYGVGGSLNTVLITIGALILLGVLGVVVFVGWFLFGMWNQSYVWKTISDYHCQLQFELPFETTSTHLQGKHYFETNLGWDEMTESLNKADGCYAELTTKLLDTKEYSTIYITVDRAGYLSYFRITSSEHADKWYIIEPPMIDFKIKSVEDIGFDYLNVYFPALNKVMDIKDEMVEENTVISMKGNYDDILLCFKDRSGINAIIDGDARTITYYNKSNDLKYVISIDVDEEGVEMILMLVERV